MHRKPIQITVPEKGKIYFLSDAHLNHNRPWIVDVRGFKTIEEHNKWIEKQLFNLTSDDILINLGDFTLMQSVEYTRSVFNRIQATHYYAAYGNHESFVSKIYYSEVQNQFGLENVEVYPLTTHLDGKFQPLIFLGESSTFKIENYHVYCRHMAPLIWDKMKDDHFIALIGHSHSNLEHANIHTPEPKILDIGVDNAKKYNGTCFFEWNDIKTIMNKKQNKTYDHH